MGLFGNVGAVSTIVPQLLRRSKLITFNSLSTDIDNILDQAALSDLRLLGCVSDWHINYTRTLNKRIEMQVTYDDYLPDSFDDVIIDTSGAWRPVDLLKNGGKLPAFVRIVTKDCDVTDLEKRITEDIPKLKAAYFGPLKVSFSERHKVGGWACSVILFSAGVDQNDYEAWQKMARRQVETISQGYLGGQTPPPFMRVFLALSYLQQNCNYDEEAAATVIADPEAVPKNAYVLYPYGPLCKGAGICEGISAAFKMLMDFNGVECLIVEGEADGEGHKWNIVKLNDMYYHVDPTAGITGDGVYVGGFLKTDSDMAKNDYIWDTDMYPRCLGRHFDYNAVEDYIEDNGPELLANNVDPTYLMPNNILM